MQINLQFDSDALAAPQSFRDAIQAAANIIDQTFTDAIAVNIAVGYGELDGTALTNGEAEAETLMGDRYPYATVRGLLLDKAQSNVQSGVTALPSTTTLQGHGRVLVWSGIEKVLGLISPTDTALDSAVGFAKDISTSLLVGVALHELTHAMGRASGPSTNLPTVFDLYRYTSPGAHLFGSNLPGASSYFSLDGGYTDIADYGTGSDPSDYLNNGKAPYDPFEEVYVRGTYQYLTALDIEQMEALGFHTTPAAVALGTFSAGPNLYWENVSGMVSLWQLNGSAPPTGVNLPPAAGWQIQDVGDFNGDGLAADLVLRNTSTGMVQIWTDDAGRMSIADVAQVGLDWSIMGAADFNGDGKSDILWRNEHQGDVSIWLMNGNQAQSSWNPGPVGLEWRIVGAADYAGGGDAQILWRNAATGEVDMWSFDSGTGRASGSTVASIGLEWEVVGSGDFNGDGKADILWRNNADHEVVVWEMDAAHVLAAQTIAVLGPQWTVADVLDVNSDGRADIVWRDSGTGQVVLWDMNGFNVQQAAVLGAVDNSWQTVNHHFDWV